MPRVASLWFPTLRTDRLRPSRHRSPPAEPGPLVTACAERGRRVVVACSAKARAAGLKPGMPIAQARVLVPGLAVAEADLAAEAALLARIADRAARRWTPLVKIDGVDSLLLDVGAAAHLAGGEAALLRRMRATARALGLASRVAVADTAGVAWGLARHGATRLAVVPPGQALAEVSALPAAALRLDGEMLGALARLGFDTVGAILAAPRAPLIRRFGATLGERLDRLAGHRAEPIPPRLPPDVPHVRRTLVEPIGTADAIGLVMKDLAADLCAVLERDGLGLRRAALICARVDAREVGTVVGLARPTRAAVHLADLLVRRIETIDPGFGIEAMTLAAVAVGHLPPEQPTMLAPRRRGRGDNVVAFPGHRLADAAPPPEPDLAQLVDRLANRFGAPALHRAGAAESDAPGRMAMRLDPLAPATARSWRVDWPRPVRLLRRPDKVERFLVDLPDHAPDFFVWRGRRLKVTGADGPERVFGEWWRGGRRHRTRDYFQVEVEGGGRYWLFRLGDGVDPETGPGDWYVHGAFG